MVRDDDGPSGAAEDALVPVHVNRVMDGLGMNPALPAALVRRLVQYRGGFGEVAKRPDLAPAVIEEILAADDHWHVHSLALNPALPHPVRLRLAGHPDGGVRAALVVGAQPAPRDLVERLIEDPDRRVREYLAQRDDIPADLMGRLAADPDPRVRATVARSWTKAPEVIRRALLTDPVDEVRAHACATYFARLPHPVPPADLVPALLDDPVTRAGAVRHATLTAGLTERLATDPDARVRRQLAEHPQLPPPVRDRLAADADARVLVGIFGRQDTPEPVRQRIHDEIHRRARSVDDLLDGDVDDAALEQQANDLLAVSELRDLRLDWVTADPLPYVASPYICFRAAAARSQRLPADAVVRLLGDDNSRVRTTMATTAPHLVDSATAERIDREYRPAKKTRWRPADTFAMPPETLRRLASDPDPRMRQLAARDPELPTVLVERLATDPDSRVRRSAVGHPHLPLRVHRALLADTSEWVAQAAAASPALPVTEMRRLLDLAGLATAP